MSFLKDSLIARAAAAVVLSLAAWWFLLKKACLALLWAAAYFPLALTVGAPGGAPVEMLAESGQWKFNVAIDGAAHGVKTADGQAADSVEFVGDADNVAFFTSGWVVYLALSGVVGGFAKKRWVRTLKGFGAQLLVSVLALALYAYINGYGNVLNGQAAASTFLWWLRWAYHIDYLVVPFAGPFIVAVAVHPEWREYVLKGLGEAGR